MKSERLLIIFTKNPEAGLVKTRLASSVGEEKALEIYETLRHHTAFATEKVDAARAIFYSRFIPASDLLLTGNATAMLQEGKDLGERMLHAIQTGFETGYRHIVLIGTDCYELSSSIIESAFVALERSDAVLGPASDGGFYLVGLNRLTPELFLDRKWSTPEVLAESIAILHRHAVTPELLPELSDIDTIDDLKKSGLWNPPKISIIIPTWNEEAGIAHSLQALINMTRRSAGIEIIVSDASTDRTPEILTGFPVKLCRTAKGRAAQMNAGAQLAEGETLYFLHADTIPPETFIDDIRSAMAAGKKAGCFRMHFDDDHPLMSLFGWFTQFPLTLFRGGDQSLFVEKQLFLDLGGFDETLQVMEDIDIINRLERRTGFHILKTEVTTSARKYHRNGIIPLQLIFGTIHLMYALGFDQESIIRYYRENIT